MCLQSLSLWAEATWYRTHAVAGENPTAQQPLDPPVESVALEVEVPRPTDHEPAARKESIRV